MGRRTNRDWQRQLEMLLREAAQTAKGLSGRGCWPTEWRSAMPDVVRDRNEAYGYVSASYKPAPPTAQQIDRFDEIANAVSSCGDLTDTRRNLIWDRAHGVPVKISARRLGVSRYTLWREYNKALASFGAHLIACNISNKATVQHRRVSAA